MTQTTMEVATLGGGCFWCLDAVYRQIRGIHSVVSGYAGGSVDAPSYEQICTGRTGHAEVVRLTYDASIISYRDLLEIFFTIHDPTTLNRQGNDVGSQYRSVIYFHDDAQRAIAAELIGTTAALWDAAVVTELTPVPRFYTAETYHQDYFRQNPQQGYCSYVVQPKVAKARKAFATKWLA